MSAMRPSFWIKWIPVAVFAVAVSPCAGRAADPPTPAEAVSAHMTRVDTDPGRGETEEAARDEARKKACTWFEDYLDFKYGDIGWKPTAAELIAENVVRLDQPQPMDIKPLHGYEVTAHVDLSDAALRRLQPELDRARRQALEQVRFQREGLAARALAALVALCLVVLGYLRLEDLTRGYYTVLLRLTAGAVVLLTLAGLFLLP